MRICGVLMLGAALAAAQTPADPVRGVLLERDPQTANGEFSVRLPDHEVLRYRFDAQTRVERDKGTIDVARLHPGEKIEVASDPIPGLVLRYARAVQVIADPVPAPRRPIRRNLGSADRFSLARDLEAGAQAYSGIVSFVAADRIVLRTRDGEQTLALRPDTRFIENGSVVDSAALKKNTRVFVRGGKDLWEQLQAYQIVWGRILQP